jgi:hypothetical protein
MAQLTRACGKWGTCTWTAPPGTHRSSHQPFGAQLFAICHKRDQHERPPGTPLAPVLDIGVVERRRSTTGADGRVLFFGAGGLRKTGTREREGQNRTCLAEGTLFCFVLSNCRGHTWAISFARQQGPNSEAVNILG